VRIRKIAGPNSKSRLSITWKTLRVRCVTTPDAAQKVLLNRLGLNIPQRLRYLDEVAQM